MRRQFGVYLLMVLVPSVVAVFAIAHLADGPTTGAAGAPSDSVGHVMSRLLIAVSVVVALAALAGAVARRLGQPRVVGELIAGLVLGPSVFGALAPAVQERIFPPSILPHLDTLAQFGVIFFMFLVGAELVPGELRRGGSRPLVIGHASIAVPFLGGVLTTWWLLSGYRPDGVGVVPFVLFVGVAFGITAFPVLARILSEQGLLRSPLGTTGMAAAGVGDVTAWCLLAVVVAIVRGTSLLAAALSIALVVAFALAMVGAVRPLVTRAVRRAEHGGSRVVLLAGLVCLVLGAALATDRIGVHPIFGAFLAGVIMPRDSPLVTELTSKIEGITLWLMLPLFFVSVGLHTRLGALDQAAQWLTCLAVIVVAVLGKTLGGAAAAAATGGSARESAALGVMMNCRGLTELVVLNLGLQLGVLPPPLFVMFVIMALVTTAMTGPLLRLALGPRATAAAEPELVLTPNTSWQRSKAGDPAWSTTDPSSS